jgi:N utilization substance protein B
MGEAPDTCLEKVNRAMGSRRRCREIILQILYQIEMSGLEPRRSLALYWEHFAPAEDVREFVTGFLLGVCTNREQIDAVVNRYSEHWKLERMDCVDRNALRMGVYELLYCPDVPPKVAMNEAIELGKKFGSEESGAFINGILDRIQHEKAHGETQYGRQG